MSKWIWFKEEKEDQYVEFVSTFESSQNKVSLKICADTDYMVFVNKKLVAFGQYNFYPEHPVYDLLDIKCKKGLNNLKIVVYHCGASTFSTYCPGKAGLFFEIKDGSKTVLESNEKILSAESKLYKTGMKQNITPQLGYRMFVDGTKIKSKLNYENSVVVEKSTNFRPRDNFKLKLLKRCDVDTKVISKKHYLIDLKRETVGYLDFDFVSPKKQKIQIAWGEHIVDGKVRETIEFRKFVTEYIAKKGRNKFFSTFRRYGLRYLEVYCEEDIDIDYFGIIPTEYPFKDKKWSIDDPLRKKIYEVGIHTLKCCYHEHFEDCPWREQSFYAMDSRNQMLYHSLVFKNKETFKSALRLLTEDQRDDGLLNITFPNKLDLTIPSYSQYIFEEFLLYYQMSKDIDFLKESYPKLLSVLNAFLVKFDGKLLKNYTCAPYWNFYEWIPGLDDDPWFTGPENDCLANLLLIIALQFMMKINKVLGKTDDYKTIIKALKVNINKKYFVKEKGLYYFSDKNPKFYKLVNSFAILAGVAVGQRAVDIAEKLVNSNDLISSSLSMRCFQYDALIKVNKEKYKDYILNDLDSNFKKELDEGATSFWETEKGEADFNGAGSLCHAWSSLAIYYYNKFGIVKH